MRFSFTCRCVSKEFFFCFVFLYSYAVNILCIKAGDWHGFHCMLKQAEIDVQSTSNRKLPNFYEKVTDFLLGSYRISKWWQNHAFTEAWGNWCNQRVLMYYTDWLFIQAVCMFMRSRVSQTVCVAVWWGWTMRGRCCSPWWRRSSSGRSQTTYI